MGEPESEPETHDDDVELMKCVFKGMGGTVIEKAPKRPHSIPPIRNAFYMELENKILREWNTSEGIPRGPRRFENAKWAESFKKNRFRYYSVIDWDGYVEWVSRGGGDECFQEE